MRRRCGSVRIVFSRNAKRNAPILIAGRIGIISALGAVVIIRGRYRPTDSRSTDGGSASAYAPTTARIAATIDAAVIAAVDASDATNAGAASAAAIGQGISRNARDSEDGGGGDGNDGSMRHEVFLSQVGRRALVKPTPRQNLQKCPLERTVGDSREGSCIFTTTNSQQFSRWI